MNKNMMIRIGLAVFAVLGTFGITWVLLHGSAKVHAAGVQANTQADPWGLAADGKGNIWVAEPGCDASPPTPMLPTLLCNAPPPAFIGQYNANSNTLIKNFPAPTGVTPVFVAVDGNGNIWFTDTLHNLIGELTTATGQYTTFPLPKTNEVPYDLVIVNNNVWFTEFQASQIGFFNTATHQFQETPIPTTNANPYGITIAPNGHIWFAENNPTIAKLGEFAPTTSGTGIKIAEHATTHPGAHLLAADSNGNIFFTEGFSGDVGEYTTAGIDKEFNVSLSICPQTPSSATPVVCQGDHISGIAVDRNNNVVFDDSLSARVGLLNPGGGTYSIVNLQPSSHPHDGVIVDANNNVWAGELFGQHLDEFTAGTLPSQPNVNTPAGPVGATWYFAEGRVGRNFREYLTVENPNATPCNLTITYQYTMDGAATPGMKTVTPTVAANTRLTESVNADLGIPDTSSRAASLSAIVKASGCTGVVAERPMYFMNFHGLSSGTDALGATQLGTSYTFADIPTGNGTNTFLTILNPGGNPATVKATYYANGKAVGTQSITAGPNTRATIFPNSIALPNHVAVVVTSNQPVIVERPSYFMNANGVSGAADVVGATPGKDWLFAEGYANTNSQETLTIANVDPTSAAVKITLESKMGAKQSFNVTVAAQSQLIWNVNANNNFANASPEVSAEVTSTGANVVVQREMYFQYHHTLPRGTLQSRCITDVMGLPAATIRSAYSFAEGYTNVGYNTWITVQNPTAKAETIYVTLVNGLGQKYTQAYPVGATTRLTIDLTDMMQTGVSAGNGPNAINSNAVSITVQTLNNGGTFLAERPLYFNTMGTSPFAVQGGTDIIGY